VKAPPFRYLRPVSVTQALDWLRDEDTKVLAGGQSLVPLLNLRLARPERLVDANALPELGRIIPDARSLLLGALVRHRDLERDRLVVRHNPLLAEAAGHIGHLGIRNRGTLGGTLSHADPASEIPLVAAVMGATIYLESGARGRRPVPAGDFATGFFSTVAEPDEMLTWVRMPALQPGEGWGFVEFARRHGDFAMAGAAVTIRLAPSGRIASARAGVLAAADTPLVLSTADLVGSPTDDATLTRWARAVTKPLRPAQEPDYRRRLAATALSRALRHAVRRCGEFRDV